MIVWMKMVKIFSQNNLICLIIASTVFGFNMPLWLFFWIRETYLRKNSSTHLSLFPFLSTLVFFSSLFFFFFFPIRYLFEGNTFEQAIDFLREKIYSRNKFQNAIYAHICVSIDTMNIKYIWDATRDIVLHRCLCCACLIWHYLFVFLLVLYLIRKRMKVNWKNNVHWY